MPRILVTGDDGTVFWDESVAAADFEADHFRRALADRLWWAVGDAECGRPLAGAPSHGAPSQTPQLAAAA